MASSGYYPYRSQALKESCLAYIDKLAAKDWPIPAEERLVPTSYGETFVRIGGPLEAPPLVLLHGAASTSLMWTPNIEALSSAFRTYAVDQIGEFGKSVYTKPLPTLDDLMTWLDELLEGLGLHSGVNLAGLSYGGALTVQYALRFPGKLNKIVLLAPAESVLRSSAMFMFRLTLAALSSRRFLAPLVRWMFADMARQDMRWIDATNELLFTNMQSMERRAVVFPPVLSDAEWAGLQVPALFLVGDHEVIYAPQKAIRRLNRVAPQVRTELIPNAGHDLSFVQTDLVNRRMLEFLRGGACSSCRV